MAPKASEEDKGKAAKDRKKSSRSCLGVCLSGSVVMAAVAVALPFATGTAVHFKTAWDAVLELYHLPQKEIDEFFDAYKHLEVMPAGMPSDADKKAVHDYYRVLHRILAVGVVMEIMLVPPVIDRKAGILANLDLWQDRMMAKLELAPGDKVLDTGCGRGIIARNVAQRTKTSVYGVNIDESQLKRARAVAKESGLESRLFFHQQDYNEPFTFLADASMDGHYCAQACMFVNNKTTFMKHSARVLKPGARFYGLEWISLPNYDPNNATKVKLVQRAATILGTSMPYPISEWTKAFEANGFKIIYVGHPTPINSVELLEDINDVYAPLQHIISFLGRNGLISDRLVKMFERLRMNWEDLRTMMREELATPTYELIAEKL